MLPFPNRMLPVASGMLGRDENVTAPVSAVAPFIVVVVAAAPIVVAADPAVLMLVAPVSVVGPDTVTDVKLPVVKST